ncbi:MAG: dihydroorotate dehydrogenase electron transfer subunit [Actinomycetota bacterium]|nr:dihydroorotate dehydrogenase electron transfer subunit [Actinomycetota bacterium]
MTVLPRSGGRVVMGRPGAGSLRVLCPIIDRRREGSYLSLIAAAPEIAERAEPGQFVNVGVETRASLLRRPFSIYRTSRHGGWGGTVQFVFDAHGPGTSWLGEQGPNDTLDLVGPLGAAFPLPEQRTSCLLIGGGYGAAALFFLAELLQRRAQRVDMIIGAATGERIFNPIEAKRMSASARFTTEDGTFGKRGRVTDVFDEVVDDCRSGLVYACGPMPMLRAVAHRAAMRQLPCHVAVEEHMACGIGVCWTCVVPVRSDDGQVHMRRSCIDGPVLNSAHIAWERSRWVSAPSQSEFVAMPALGREGPQGSGSGGPDAARHASPHPPGPAPRPGGAPVGERPR